MSDSAISQKEKYSIWATENLGDKTGIWYSPFLEQLGILLEKFDLCSGYKLNFFDYKNYEEFKKVYQDIIEQSDDDIDEILNGAQKRYPESHAEMKLNWKKRYAQYTVEKGERKNSNDFGGIPNIGVLLRSYLKFLYYDENPATVYPKREKKIASQEGDIDTSVNYWVISPGEGARLWDEFRSDSVIALGWDYLGDLNSYHSKEEVERKISEIRADSRRPTNDTKAVWDFYKEIQVGDVVYVKDGIRKIIASGTVISDYYFDDSKKEYRHRRKVEWTQIGSWELHQAIAQKTMTCLNSYLDVVQEIEQLLRGDIVDTADAKVNEFRTWLSNQVTDSGETLNDKTVLQKVSALKDIEKHFETSIFGETDIEELKQLKDIVATDESYSKYKGVTGSAIDYYIRFIESKPTVQENDAYSSEEFLADVFIESEKLTRLMSVLQNKKNLIMKGAPGVGKTYIVKRLAYVMMEEKDESRIQVVQFHQSYSYEDFIEGYRPKAEGEGFELKQGPFVKFARKAARDPERDYFFIIDEINRGNMSKIFGELMVLIETDKRGEQINLLYSNDKFSVPPNLYIIGMMNTADRSLALLDYALRRRFSFVEITPAFENETFGVYVKNLNNPKIMLKVIGEIKQLNKQIVEELGMGFQIGHSYFTGDAYKVDSASRVVEVVEYEIIPQLFEYWFDDEAKAEAWAERLRSCCYDKE